MSADDVIADIARRLPQNPPEASKDVARLELRKPLVEGRDPVPAAVLIALIRRAEGLTVLYTERSEALRAHSGQIAFPGGKVDDTDTDVAAAALREASEEVALSPADVEIMGYLQPLYTGTNYLITPVVGVVTPRSPFVPNPEEVSGLFEVPLPVLADHTNYELMTVEFGRERHKTWKIPFQNKAIWGITAHLTRQFRQTALDEDGV